MGEYRGPLQDSNLIAAYIKEDSLVRYSTQNFFIPFYFICYCCIRCVAIGRNSEVSSRDQSQDKRK